MTCKLVLQGQIFIFPFTWKNPGLNFFSLNLFYLFCVCVLFYSESEPVLAQQFNHLFSTENEVSMQMHEGPEEN